MSPLLCELNLMSASSFFKRSFKMHVSESVNAFLEQQNERYPSCGQLSHKPVLLWGYI